MDFDRWRAEYNSTPFADQVAIYDEIAKQYPVQRQFCKASALKAMDGVGSVVELGGWRGELADAVLRAHPAIRWRNYDICRWAVENPSCRHHHYAAQLLEDWPWETELESADVFVASHVIEHMRFAQFAKLAKQLFKFNRLYLDVPVGEDPPDWRGYPGTHILETGWRRLDVLLQNYGFTSADKGHKRIYER